MTFEGIFKTAECQSYPKLFQHLSSYILTV